MAQGEKLTQMVSVSLTPAQAKATETATRNSGVNKVGTYIRIVLVQELMRLGLLSPQDVEGELEDE